MGKYQAFWRSRRNFNSRHAEFVIREPLVSLSLLLSARPSLLMAAFCVETSFRIGKKGKERHVINRHGSCNYVLEGREMAKLHVTQVYIDFMVKRKEIG